MAWRCSFCNGILERVEDIEVLDYENCPKCKREYWYYSHSSEIIWYIWIEKDWIELAKNAEPTLIEGFVFR